MAKQNLTWDNGVDYGSVELFVAFVEESHISCLRGILHVKILRSGMRITHKYCLSCAGKVHIAGLGLGLMVFYRKIDGANGKRLAGR